MPNEKQSRWKLFLGIGCLLGGIICILVPALSLHDRSSISTILLGIMGVMLGMTFFWEAIEGFRERKRERQNKKDTEVQ